MTVNTFEQVISDHGMDEGLYCDAIETVQVNVGLICNQACTHCHVNASPDRKETMEWPVMEKAIAICDAVKPKLVDITGGAPELNKQLARFIQELHKKNHPIQVRTNLTALEENDGPNDLMSVYCDKKVKLIASLPCYLEENVTSQRGPDSYKTSISAIRKFNKLGYGIKDGLTLDLVYNPLGPTLPPKQAMLEEAYKEELGNRFGIVFNKLLTITNMPIGRFGDLLKREQKDEDYMNLLMASFNPNTVASVMCKQQIEIGWDGRIFDCDFNLALDMPVNHSAPNHIDNFDKGILESRKIVTSDHCFGCTAGAGSSCGGALEK